MKRFALLIVAVFILMGSEVFAGKIYLRNGTIDTTNAHITSDVSPSSAIGSGYYLVALNGPIHDEDKFALALAGAQLLEYIPDYTFVVKMEHSAYSSVKKLGCVEWVGPFRPEYKLGEISLDSDGLGQYLVQMFPGQNAEQAIKKVKASRVICAGDSRKGSCKIVASASQLAELVKSGSVAWIEPYVHPKTCNNIAGIVTGVPTVRQNIGLYGNGQIIGVADTGLDTGNLATMSIDFANRIDKAYALRRPNDWSDLKGHGTHTIGSLLGSGALSGSSPAMHNYDGSYAGVAPEAHLVFQSIGDDHDFVFPPLHLAELFQPAYDDGARVHSNSWGSAVTGQYTVYSNEVDQFCWDHKDFSVVFAAGNDGLDRDQDGVVDKDSIYAPGSAKNCICVGASESTRVSGGWQLSYGILWPRDGWTSPINSDLVSNNINGMVAFSSRGPTDDNRVKPDICAPGTNILSNRTHAANVSGWKAYDSNYIFWGGTSMSTPQVAGAAALVREYFQAEKGINPSAALVKATLINGACDMAPGQYGVGSKAELQYVPDYSQGWGRLDIKQSLSPNTPTVNEFTDASSGLSTGGYSEYQYNVTNVSVPFKATLVWTDYPGAVHAAKELVNDLDITITTPSGLVYPTFVSADHTNNVEQVKIAHPEHGTYTIRVSGYNIPMGPQDYALAVSGGMPDTYIAGTVKSSSGAGVQGAVVAIVSGGNIKRVSTNTNGKYLTHMPAGAYSVQVSKQGWTFSPRAKSVTVVGAPVENIDFQGSGQPGNISGKVTGAVGGVVGKIIESPHPYQNSFDQTYTITAHEGATRVRAHFAEIELVNDGDMIEVLDSTGNVIDTFTSNGEDIWSSWVSGNVINIRLVTNDYGNIAYGFYIDGYETDLISQGGVDGVEFALTPVSVSGSTASDGSYALSSVPAGTYIITPSKPHWKFQPDSKTIEVPAGGTISGVDFTAFLPGSITGEVVTAASQTKAITVQSEHPYPDDSEEVFQINADPSTTRMRLHFKKVVMEPGFDYLYIMDGQDNTIESYSGTYDDLWTPWISGSLAKIMLSSDVTGNDYGFYCDKYEAESSGMGIDGVTVTLSPESSSITTGPNGAFSFPEVLVGSHTVLPENQFITFDPPQVQLSVSAGMSEHILFYIKPTELTSITAARSVPDNVAVTLRGFTVSAAFDGFFYVQDSTRLSGIRVQSSTSVGPGDVVDITGSITTEDGERRVNATVVAKT